MKEIDGKIFLDENDKSNYLPDHSVKSDGTMREIRIMETVSIPMWLAIEQGLVDPDEKWAIVTILPEEEKDEWQHADIELGIFNSSSFS